MRRGTFRRHFSPKLCDALAALGIDARHVRRDLGDAAGDPGWIGLAGERGWVIVTCDFKIRTPESAVALWIHLGKAGQYRSGPVTAPADVAAVHVWQR